MLRVGRSALKPSAAVWSFSRLLDLTNFSACPPSNPREPQIDHFCTDSLLEVKKVQFPRVEEQQLFSDPLCSAKLSTMSAALWQSSDGSAAAKSVLRDELSGRGLEILQSIIWSTFRSTSEYELCNINTLGCIYPMLFTTK